MATDRKSKKQTKIKTEFLPIAAQNKGAKFNYIKTKQIRQIRIAKETINYLSEGSKMS